MTARTALVFGGSGTLGSAIVDRFRAEGWDVAIAGREHGDRVEIGIDEPGWAERLHADPDAVVWAQGLNLTGSAPDVTEDEMLRALDANVLYIPRTLRALTGAGRLTRGSRLVIVSSIWQISARAAKLAYVTSKAALSGMIPALAADLAPAGIAVNAVLPGVIDTPMTRAQLRPEQVTGVEAATPGGALAQPENVAAAAVWLAGPDSIGINAVSLPVDAGWSAVRHV